MKLVVSDLCSSELDTREDRVVRRTSLQKQRTGWNTEANKIKLLEMYKNFDPSLIALLDKAEAKSLKAWELLDMDVLSSWVNDRLALLGDAAHPFLPRKLPTLSK
jgi:2-polyprenyl-6-methoxyphenol hydroxylase-like FAD-dependent oxidoreductase